MTAVHDRLRRIAYDAEIARAQVSRVRRLFVAPTLRVGYHITPRPWVGKILDGGLVASSDGYVWIFGDRDVALEAVTLGNWHGYDRVALLVVYLDGLEVVPDPHPGWGDWRPRWDDTSFAVRGYGIEPERLRLYDEEVDDR